MAKGYNKEFIIDIQRFVTKSENTVNDVRKLISYDLFSNVIDRTPIYFSHLKTSGNTKFNWQCSIGAMSTRILKGVDKKGATTKARMLAVLQRLKGDESVFFANSVPWIFHIEDGLYTKNPIYGSYNSRTKEYEIRTIGGFSKGGDLGADSTHGMVKMTLADYPHIYQKALRKAKAMNK